MEFLSRVANGLRLRFRPKGTLLEYESPELVEVVFQKTKLFQPTDPWTELNEARTVLDFGGGCGIHYKEAQYKEAQLERVRWAVVETLAMVARASELETGNLKFFAKIADAAAWLGDIDVIYSNGALQYTPDPATTLKELCDLGAKALLWKRVVFSDRVETEQQISWLSQNGPGTILGVPSKAVRHYLTPIPESTFLAFHRGYRLEFRSEDTLRFVKEPE